MAQALLQVVQTVEQVVDGLEWAGIGEVRDGHFEDDSRACRTGDLVMDLKEGVEQARQLIPGEVFGDFSEPLAFSLGQINESLALLREEKKGRIPNDVEEFLCESSELMAVTVYGINEFKASVRLGCHEAFQHVVEHIPFDQSQGLNDIVVGDLRTRE